ncbi:MAG: helix-turn-helix transcriptional regulator [Clostridiales bacterium]|nr:helix-turn-helix transcriptional regulator [Clostridiales bacterium]
MSLKNQFKYYRNQSKLKQEEVALRIGVTRQCYAHYEQGVREPSIDIIRKLCILFNCTADELLEIDTPSERAKVQINNSFNNSSNINVKIK